MSLGQELGFLKIWSRIMFESWQPRGGTTQGSRPHLKTRDLISLGYLSFWVFRAPVTSIIGLISSSLKQDTKECTRHPIGNSAKGQCQKLMTSFEIMIVPLLYRNNFILERVHSSAHTLGLLILQLS